nr:unnamed protein product [Digitaria exilis]
MADECDGVGLKRLQFTTRTPMSPVETPVLASRASMAPNMTDSASARASAMLRSFVIGGEVSMARGEPDRWRTFCWNARLSAVNTPAAADWRMKVSWVTTFVAREVQQVHRRWSPSLEEEDEDGDEEHDGEREVVGGGAAESGYGGGEF